MPASISSMRSQQDRLLLYQELSILCINRLSVCPMTLVSRDRGVQLAGLTPVLYIFVRTMAVQKVPDPNLGTVSKIKNTCRSFSTARRTSPSQFAARFLDTKNARTRSSPQAEDWTILELVQKNLILSPQDQVE